jgi:hypothetical protein
LDRRVIAYVNWQESDSQILTDAETLKEIFPVALDSEHYDAACSYFALPIVIGMNGPYTIVASETAEDSLRIYNVIPINNDVCPWGQTFDVHALLFCDKAGGLKDRIDFKHRLYSDPDWNCKELAIWNPFFEYRKSAE